MFFTVELKPKKVIKVILSAIFLGEIVSLNCELLSVFSSFH